MSNFLAHCSIKVGTGFLPSKPFARKFENIEEAVDQCNRWREGAKKDGCTFEDEPDVYQKAAYYKIKEKDFEPKNS